LFTIFSYDAFSFVSLRASFLIPHHHNDRRGLHEESNHFLFMVVAQLHYQLLWILRVLHNDQHEIHVEANLFLLKLLVLAQLHRSPPLIHHDLHSDLRVRLSLSPSFNPNLPLVSNPNIYL